MADLIKMSLQEELKYYTRLLSEHENKTKKKPNLQKTACETPQNLQFAYKNTKDQPLACLESNFYSNNSRKFIKNNNECPSRRTVLYGQTPKFVFNQTPGNANCFNSFNRTVLTKASISKSTKYYSKTTNIEKTVSPNSMKKTLMDEIATLTMRLKQKSNLNTFSKKKNELLQEIQSQHTSTSLGNNNVDNFNKCSSKSENLILESQKESCKMPLKSIPVKLNNSTVNDHKRSQSNVQAAHSKSTNKEICTKFMCQSLKPFVQTKNYNENGNNMFKCNKTASIDNLFKKQMPKTPNSHCFKSVAVSQSKSLLSNKKRLYIRKNADASKSHLLNKSFHLHKAYFKPKFDKMNKKYSLPVNKRQKVNKYVLHKSVLKKQLSNEQKIGKGNSKYKVINKTITPCSIKKKFKFQKHSLDSLSENSLLLDKSDPLFELLQNKAATDKLEQVLLAKSTSAIISEPVSNDQMANKLSSGEKVFSSRYKFKNQCRKKSKVNTKYKVVNKTDDSKCFMPVNKSKILTKYKVYNKGFEGAKNSAPMRKSNVFTKYKFVNKISGDSKSFITPKIKVSPLFKNTTKKNKSLLSKHSLNNKQLYLSTPKLNKNPILVKRVFKSKSTIINKNISPITNSAKMVKSKYLILNRRKPKWETNRNSARHFKGFYPSGGLHSRQNRIKDFRQHYHLKRNRKNNFKINRYTSIKNRCIKKFNNGCMKTPIRLIKGVRYSLSSSGKTLKKLPGKDQVRNNKTPKRILIGGRSFIRVSENVMKVTSPVSANLANRVLHRSISTVRTASSKKDLSKVNRYCMFYNRFGRCNKGVNCTFIHDPSKIAVCTRFLRGTCKVHKCPFSHEIAPGKMAICSFFLAGACEKINCPYRHDQISTDVELCKAFVQGYCPNGKKCKKAHVLICPKFMQGICEKGSSCAYPHPPQKVKKNVSKDAMDDINEKEMGEVLLEKVARYFQTINEESASQCQNDLDALDKSDTVKLYVPRKRKLEEQPSFIPLSSTPLSSKS